MTPDTLFRKSIHFTPDAWADLQKLMPRLGAASPSIAIAVLITNELEKQRSAHDHHNNKTRQ